MKLTEFQKELIRNGLHDIVMWAEVLHLWELVKRREINRTELLNEVEALFRLGLMTVGQFNSAKTFVLWAGDPDELRRELEKRWRSGRMNLELGEVGWLYNTEKGDKYARDVLKTKGP